MVFPELDFWALMADEEFEADFRAAYVDKVAQSAKVQVEDVVIRSIEPGSVLVDSAVRFSETTGEDVDAFVEIVVGDPGSIFEADSFFAPFGLPYSKNVQMAGEPVESASKDENLVSDDGVALWALCAAGVILFAFSLSSTTYRVLIQSKGFRISNRQRTPVAAQPTTRQVAQLAPIEVRSVDVE